MDSVTAATVIVSLIAAGGSWHVVALAWLDLHWVRRSKRNGSNERDTREALIKASTLSIVQSLLFGLAIYRAASVPPAQRVVATSIVMMLVAVAVAFVSWRDVRLRRLQGQERGSA